MNFITAKEARALTNEALTTVWSTELASINKEIKEKAESGASSVRVDFYYREDYFEEVAKKAPMFFEELGFHTADLTICCNGHYWFTISW